VICPIQAKYDPSVTLNAALDTRNVTLCVRDDRRRIPGRRRGSIRQEDVRDVLVAFPQGRGSVARRRGGVGSEALSAMNVSQE
jgi:hypothetical protein